MRIGRGIAIPANVGPVPEGSQVDENPITSDPGNQDPRYGLPLDGGIWPGASHEWNRDCKRRK